MCIDCKHAEKYGKRLICMCEKSEYQYEYVTEIFVCDEYKPNEEGVIYAGKGS